MATESEEIVALTEHRQKSLSISVVPKTPHLSLARSRMLMRILRSIYPESARHLVNLTKPPRHRQWLLPGTGKSM
jgi:hypothetical protein